MENKTTEGGQKDPRTVPSGRQSPASSEVREERFSHGIKWELPEEADESPERPKFEKYEKVFQEYGVEESEIRIRRSLLADMEMLRGVSEADREVIKDVLKARYSVQANPPSQPVAPAAPPAPAADDSSMQNFVREFIRFSKNAEDSRIHPFRGEMNVLFDQLRYDLISNTSGWRTEARNQFFVRAREKKLSKDEVILACCLYVWDIHNNDEEAIVRLLSIMFFEKSELSRTKLHNVMVLKCASQQSQNEFGPLLDKLNVPLFPMESVLQDLNDEIRSEFLSTEMRGGGSQKPPAYLKFYRGATESIELLGGGSSKAHSDEVAKLKATIISQQETIATLTRELKSKSSEWGNRGRGSRDRGTGRGSGVAPHEAYPYASSSNQLPKND